MCAEHVANYVAIFQKMGGQMFCLYYFMEALTVSNIAIYLLSKSF